MVRHRENEPGRRSAGLARGLQAAGLAAVLLFAGCYRLVPVSPESATPPMRVRAYLTPEATARMAPVLGEARAELDGRLVERTPQGIFLEVRAGEIQQGMASEVLTQRLLLAPADVVGLQRRELDRGRTALVAGAGAAVLGAVVYDMLTGESGGTGRPPGGGGPPEVRIPLLAFPIR